MKLGFLDEAEQLLGDSEQCFLDLEKSSSPGAGAPAPASYEQLFRLAHNLKGSAAAVGFDELKAFTHQLESLILKLKKGELALGGKVVGLLLTCNDRMRQMVKELREDLFAKFDNTELMTQLAAFHSAPAPLAPKPATVAAPTHLMAKLHAETEAHAPMAFAESAPATGGSTATAPGGSENGVHATTVESIRVSLDRLDRLIDNVGELVISHTFIEKYRGSLGTLSEDATLAKRIDELGKVVREIRQISMSLRMVPLKSTFQKMQRIVRDTSRALGKEVIFFTTGDDTEIDKTVLERIGDPLVHLIRNAVDHGLESPAARKAAGKTPAGTIQLNAYHRGGNVMIEVRDDGGGMDPAKLTAKAIEKGILPAGTHLSASDAYQLIFAPGFSTKAEVTEISGRGVGMDVVKQNIKELQGVIHIESAVGKGTTFRVALPLTLAIVDGMVVRIGQERFVVPMSNVYESVRPKRDEVETGGLERMRLRGETLPVFRLADLLGRPGARPDPWNATLLVVRDLKEHPFTLLVDDIEGSQQVVIKPLGKDLDGLPGVAGGAILGDGQAALILDINQIIEASL
ncbi:MAG: chemotaxis protein CheA [Deltaproteobacteria bacterium]|nr:chemotaxis protein CheA [Deltaproteobacteria bacterium]